jgi:hypothetical protein
VLTPGQRDSISWRWTSDGVFSVGSAYEFQFEGRFKAAFLSSVRDSDAPLKCQFFAWLAVLDRCLTADNLQKRAGLMTLSARCAALYLKLVCTSF